MTPNYDRAEKLYRRLRRPLHAHWESLYRPVEMLHVLQIKGADPVRRRILNRQLAEWEREHTRMMTRHYEWVSQLVFNKTGVRL